MVEAKKRVAMLSNVTVDLIAAKLRRRYDFYLPEGFDTWVQETINPASGLYLENFDAIIVLLDGTEARTWKGREEATERITLWKQALDILAKSITAIPIFISTIDIRENRIKSLSERKFSIELENEWYQFVQDLIEEKNNLYIFDLMDVIAEFGRKQFYSNKMWYMSSMPYSKYGLDIVATEISRVLNSVFSIRKKIIVLDLDNTLWGGVIGEDGIEGIELSDHKEGQRYYDFQRQLLEMKNRGIVLAVNSKNNEKDAENAIQNHSAMLLRDDDFVSRKINWVNKATNLKTMETELNLTESGFIFIDDNPAERAIVSGECPEVLVPDFPIDTAELLSFAEDIWFDYCCPLRVLEESMKKTQMYHNEARRKQEMSESLNLEGYIKKLEIIVDIHKMRPEELERVTQLCSKVNQFNVTTKRYMQIDIERIAKDPNNAIYVVYSSDKYGDCGLISVVILIEEDTTVRIDTFLMSCRVMGRELEAVILNELAAKYAGKQKIIGEFIPTAKNTPVKELYDRLGFEQISNEGGHKTYQLIVAGYEKKQFDSYKEIRFEEVIE